jgi:Fe-S oxidoreductase
MVELGLLPKAAKDYLRNVQRHGNPYGLPTESRKEWMADLVLPAYNGQPFLYHVGCEGAFDTRAQHAARALARVLVAAEVPFGVLGNDEVADGNDVDMLGECWLAETLAEKNIERFRKTGVQTIVTLSPHAFNAFKNSYPHYGGRFETLHYTQMLQSLVAQEKLRFKKDRNMKITFHDPCLLGRWNGEYRAPRKVLGALPGVELVEMERNRKSALCCGGGAGNYYIDLLGGSEESPARIRAREAHATGAQILVTACPNCLTMLEDAVKVEGLEEDIKVMDLCEVVNDMLELS